MSEIKQPVRHTCAVCGRAIAPCSWCGESEPLTVDGTTYPVTVGQQPPSNYHEPCRQAEQGLLHKSGASAA